MGRKTRRRPAPVAAPAPDEVKVEAVVAEPPKLTPAQRRVVKEFADRQACVDQLWCTDDLRVPRKKRGRK